MKKFLYTCRTYITKYNRSMTAEVEVGLFCSRLFENGEESTMSIGLWISLEQLCTQWYYRMLKLQHSFISVKCKLIVIRKEDYNCYMIGWTETMQSTHVKCNKVGWIACLLIFFMSKSTCWNEKFENLGGGNFIHDNFGGGQFHTSHIRFYL